MMYCFLYGIFTLKCHKYAFYTQIEMHCVNFEGTNLQEKTLQNGGLLWR